MKSCYEAKYRRAATQEVLENMSDAEKSRLITESVTQTTLHFEKRVVKLVREFLKPGWFQDDCEDDFECNGNLVCGVNNCKQFRHSSE